MWWSYEDGLLSPGLFSHMFALYPMSAALLYVGACAVCVLSLVPTLPLSLLAGTLWGPLLGGLISAISTFLGTTGAFYAARLIFGQPFARRFDGRHIARLQREFDNRGWKFVAFIRLNPFLPTGVLNYLLGLTSIKALTYIWVTFAFLLPQDFATALIGHKIGRVMVTIGGANTINIFMGLSAVVVLPVIIWYGARSLHLVGKRTLLNGGSLHRKGHNSEQVASLEAADVEAESAVFEMINEFEMRRG